MTGNDIVAKFGIGNDFFDFVEKNKDEDTTKLLLSKKNKNLNFDLKFATLQIKCRKRIAKKLPEIASCKKFIFPTLLSTEQCTGQTVAQFHASLFEHMANVLDLTAGLGIDDFYIADKAGCVTSVEADPLVAAALQYNMSAYKRNITVVNDDARNYIKTLSASASRFDAVFIDPARRDENSRRTYGLKDCEPNVLQMIGDIKQTTDTLFIKASPMLDIAQVIIEIPEITKIWIVGVNNECKELLLRADFKANRPTTETDIEINTLNFEAPHSCQMLRLPHRNMISQQAIKYCDGNILPYIYEPNCCIMKARAFNELSTRYDNLLKLSENSHLFTADKFYEDFPGRIFQVVETIPFKDKFIKRLNKKYPKANISTRNFILSANDVKNRLKIQDGGNIYIFATSTQNQENILIVTQKPTHQQCN